MSAWDDLSKKLEEIQRQVDAAPLNALPDRLMVVGYDPTPTEAIQVDPDLLESRLRIARMTSYGPLTDEPGA